MRMHEISTFNGSLTFAVTLSQIPLVKQQTFRIKLTPSELGAAIRTFDKDGDGMVSCPEFLLTFFRIGETMRNSRTYGNTFANTSMSESRRPKNEFFPPVCVKVETCSLYSPRRASMGKKMYQWRTFQAFNRFCEYTSDREQDRSFSNC